MLIGIGPKGFATASASATTGGVEAPPPTPANDHATPSRPLSAAPRADGGPIGVAAIKIDPGNTIGPMGAGGEDAATAGRASRVEASAPLERYRKRGEIGQDQYEAARRLARDFHFARLAPRVTARYAPRAETPTKGALAWRSQDIAGDVAAARDRVRAALRLLGPIGADVAWCVCGEGQSARDWALRTGRLKGAGMILLRAALETLVDHYDPRRREPTGILAWIAADAPANQAVGRDAA